MGPSGSGKSTLLHLAGGLERPSAGQVVVDGHDLDALDASRPRRAAPPAGRLRLPAAQPGAHAHRGRERDAPARARRRAGPQGPARRRSTRSAGSRSTGRSTGTPTTCRGGQQQRVAIARAIVGDRGLLLADEPTGLARLGDRRPASSSCWPSLVTERGCALVLVTHEPRFASWADRIVRVRDGRLTEETRPSAIGDEIEAATPMRRSATLRLGAPPRPPRAPPPPVAHRPRAAHGAHPDRRR